MLGQNAPYSKKYRAQFRRLLSNSEENVIPLSEIPTRVQDAKIPLSEQQICALMESPSETIDVDCFQKIITSKKAQPSMYKRALYTIADSVVAESQKVEVHSYIDAYTCFPPPIFIISVSIIQIAIFFYYHTTQYSPKYPITSDCAGCYINHNNSAPGPLLFTPTLRHEVWRFLSYMFLHNGITHLITNVVVQLAVGISLEVAHKLWRIAPLYLFAVATGCLLQYAFNPSVALVGASAGVYALVFAHVSNVILNWKEMPFRWLRFGILFVFIFWDIVPTLYRKFVEKTCDSISHAGHFGGGVTGFLFGYFILYNVVVHKWELILQWISVAVYSAVFLICVFLAIYREPNSEEIWKNPNCEYRT
ncbi:unnamed protein product [Caenorhabditis bovis]|uniref:Peptidase S54 rhomboid domain-containing protein n=1 Tax=Caenorhabditis bovis TaxID=2654633 RepID=A0A8S1ERM9_9PELO|nr:unnamed protein product [Caenorhabditis bovis]